MRHLILKSILCLFTAFVWSFAINGTAEGGTPIYAPSPLDQLIEEGMANNMELQGLASRVEGLKEEIPFAGSLDDPRLGIGLLNLPTDTFDFDQEPMTQKQLFIAQKIPWFGKLNLREQRQALIASREQAALEAKRLELARKIATTYYELGYISTSLDINRRLTDMVSQLIKIAETRYASGNGLQQDVLQAQVELGQLLDDKLMLERKRRTLEDRINELLNRKGFMPIISPNDLTYPGLTLDIKALQDRCLNQNPLLKIKQYEIDLAAVEVDLAKKDYWPDMDLIFAYGQREESKIGLDWADFFSATMVINVPLWQKNRQDKKLMSRQKTYLATTKSYEGLKTSLPHQIDALVTEIHDRQKNYKLFLDALMLQTEQWARASIAAYVVGKVEFNNVINAHIRLLRFELMTQQYLFTIYQKRAELEEILGGPLE